MLRPEVRSELVAIVGQDRLLDQPEELTCYAYDSFLVESMPEVVLFPKTTEEVRQILQTAGRRKIPVTARGAGTSLCGASVPQQHGIVLCFSKMNEIVEINTRDRYATVQPGVINGALQRALAPHGFFYPPDPGSMQISTMGGNVAMNAGGPRCLKYGVTLDYLMAIEVVLPSGKVVRLGSKNIKDVTGYRLSSLFCGSEGTLGIITEITVRVSPTPKAAKTVLVGFQDLDDCAEAVADIIGSGILPAAMELMDRMSVNAVEDALHLGLPKDAEGVLLIDVDGAEEVCAQEMREIIAKVKTHGASTVEEATNAEDRERLWTGRRLAFGVFAKIAPDIVTEDVTVPVSKVPAMTRKIREICEKYRLNYGIFAHAGDGNMHPLLPANRQNKDEWHRVEQAVAEMFEAAAELEGTLSGEHGIGIAKAPYLPLVMSEDSRELMQVIKQAIDPDNLLNPGKFV